MTDHSARPDAPASSSGLAGDAREFLRSLLPGNDRQLAATQYAGRSSASDRAARLRRMAHARNLAKADTRQRPGDGA